MERFKYSKFGLIGLYTALGAALAFLILFLVIGFVEVWPNRNAPIRIEFGWWVPYFMVALAGFSVFAMVRIHRLRDYYVDLSEDCIIVNDKKLKWTNIAQVEFTKSSDNNPTIILHSKKDHRLEIPPLMDGYAYIRGFIEGHARDAQRIGKVEPPVVYEEKMQTLIGLVQSWKDQGFSYSERLGFFIAQKYSKPLVESVLGEAERVDDFRGKATEMLTTIRGWKDQGLDHTQQFDLLTKQGYGPYAANLLLHEVDRMSVSR
jgi:hypothetical protein